MEKLESALNYLSEVNGIINKPETSLDDCEKIAKRIFELYEDLRGNEGYATFRYQADTIMEKLFRTIHKETMNKLERLDSELFGILNRGYFLRMTKNR